jgi:murein L,D-transpeptidase YcbB/YkuD
VKSRSLLSASAIILLFSSAPVRAADVPEAIPGLAPRAMAASATSNADIEAFMAQRRNALLWFGPARSPEAVATLAQILRRAPLDGLADGAALADEVEAAARDAAGGAPATVARADRTLSAAWLAYIAAMKAPLPGYTYSDPYLTPRLDSGIAILQRVASAPSLSAHLLAISSPNPIYTQMRDAAWVTMQRSQSMALSTRVLTNIARARIFPSTGKFLVVNAATQQLTMVEKGQIVDQMKVIVGRPDAQTPLLASTIWYATLNPYWYVPMDLTQKIVAKKMQSPIAAAYWREKRFEIMSDFGPNPTVLPPSSIKWKAVGEGKQTVYLRQLPGPGNSMGKIKFRFPNDIGVYLHDTDLPQLFAQQQRTLSNGCIRLEDAQRLGRWLMGRDPMTMVSGDAPEQHVMLPQGVPVYLTYLTAQPQADGELAFVSDVYGRDGIGPTGSVVKKIATR